MSSKEPVHPSDLIRSRVRFKQADITVLSDRELGPDAMEFFELAYNTIEGYCRKDSMFLLSYDPLTLGGDAPPLAHVMAEAGRLAGVGPMAAIAGTLSEALGRFLLSQGSKEVIVDNGGDIFLSIQKERVVGIHSGPSVLSGRMGFLIKPEDTPVGVCTSSSSVGHSVSLGDSDSVSVVAESCAIADAAATAVGNEVKGFGGVERGLLKAKKIPGIKGVLIIQGDQLGVWGVLPEVVETKKE